MHDNQLAIGVPASEKDNKKSAEAVADTNMELMLYRHALADAAAQAVFAVDPQQDYRLVFGGEAVCRITGGSEESLSGKNLQDCVPVLSLLKLKQLWLEVEKNGSASIETELRLKTGQRIAIGVSFSRFEHAGQILMAGYMQDISERRVLEAECLRLADQAASREAELRYREIFDNVTDGICLLDVVEERGFRYAGINPALTRMTGLSRADVLGRIVEETIPEDTAREMTANYRHCVEEGKPIQCEMALALPVGQKILEATLIPVKDGFGHIHRIISLIKDITARKQSEQQIGFLNFTLDQMHEAVFLVDPQRRFRYVNDRALQSLGYNCGELLGMSVPDIDPNADMLQIQAVYQQIAKQGHARFESSHQTKHGHIFPVEISATVFEYDGELMTLCVVRDISGRKQMDDALRKSREILNEAQRIAHIGSWELDLVNNKLAWSDEIYRIFEIEPEQFGASYEAFLDTVHPADREAVNRAYTESLKNREHYEIEHRLLMADGRIKYVLERCETAYADDGKPLRSIGTVQDITGRKLAEAEKQRLSVILDESPDFIGIADMQGNLRYHNRAARRMVGMAEDEELSGMRISNMHREQAAKRVLEIAIPYVMEHDVWRGDNTLLHRDGREIPVTQLVMLHRDADGKPEFLSTIMQDITERKRTEIELQQQLDFRKTLLDAMYDVGLQVMVIENGAIVHVGNRKLARQFGYSDADIDGPTPLMDIIHPDDRPRLAEYYRRRLAGEAAPANYEMGLITRSGERREFEVAVAVIPNTDPVRMVTVSKDITERKQREMIIAEQLEVERRFSRMADHIPGFLYTFKVDENGQACFPYASSGIRDIYGLQPEDVVDDMTPLHSMAHPDDQPRIEAAIAENLRTMTQFHQEVRVIHPLKGEIWVEAISTPVRESDGSILSYGVMLDITERKRMENTLSFIAQCGWKDSGEPFLTALARHLGRMLAVDYVIIDKLADDPANAETVAIYARGEVLPNMQYSLKGTPCDNVMDGGMCCYADNVQRQFPEDILLVDMQVESYAGLPLWDSSGKVIGLIAVMDGKPMSDAVAVTSILQLVATSASAELERRNSEQALSESRQFLNKVIDTIPDPVFVKDRQHRWILLNQAFCKLIGQPLEDLLGKSDFDFFPLHEAEVFWAKDEAVFHSGKENINEEEFTGSDGFVRTIVTKKTCYTGDSGEQFLVGIILDITERKCMEQALAAREQELRALAESSPGMMGSFHLRLDGSVCMPYVSPNIEELFGVHPLDVAQDAGSMMALNHPGDAERVMASIVESARTMTTWHQEWRILHPTRGERWMEGHTKPELHPEGGVVWYGYVHDITERKRSEEQIALLAHALDHVSEAVYLIDENAGFVQVNEGACRALGYTREELLSMRVFDIDPDFGPEQWRQAKLANLAGMTSVTIETRHRRKDGRIFPVEISANHMVYQNGRRYDMALARDITERKKALEAMQYSRSLLEDAQRIAHIGSWDVDIVNDVLTWSDETFRIWEIDKTQFPATFAAFLETVHPEDRDKVTDAYNDSLRNKSLYQVEHRLLFADGRVKFIAERGEPFYDAEGRPVRFVGVSLDITERKQMEAAVRQREQEFRILVESSPDPIFRYDRDCRRIYVNPAVERMTGKPAAELLHRIPSDASVLSSREGDKLVSIIRHVLETGRAAESDVAFVSPSGQQHYYHNRYAPEFGPNGETIGVISMARDITERKMAETLLRKREEEMRTLLDKSPDIIVSYDRDCRRVFSNRAHEMMGDKPRSITVGKTPLEDWVAPTGPEQAEYFMTRLRSIMETGQDEEWDIKWTDSDGQPVCYALRGQPEFDADGRIVGAMTFARDISARVRAEQAMLAREREFRSLVENLPTVVVRYDRNFNRVYTNPAYWQITGRAEPEILGKPVSASWRADNISPESYTAILAEAMSSGKKAEVALEWGDGSGRLITHAMKIVPEYDSEGQASGVLALGFDISERRQQQIVEANRLRVFEKMARGDDINSILEQVALYVESAKPGQHCCILLLNEERKLLQTVAAPSFPESYRAKLETLVLAEESSRCFGWVASALRSESVILEDLSKHQCWTVCQTFIRDVGAEACWSEPIFSASNQLLGIVSLYINQPGEPGETDLAMLRQACHLSSIAIERKRIEQKMVHQASYDPLTGLPNRRMFINRLHEEASKCRRNGSSLALLFIDLDHFKEVNDTLGHQYGDLLLVEAAERIRNSVRESDIVARLAGDEFVVIITHSADNSNAGLVGQHIVNALSERFLLENCSAHISASVGIACYPDDTDDIDQLLGYADQSMYAVKKAGRNGVNFFTRSMQDQAQERLQLSNDLRTALQEGQLQVHFQPIVNVKTGQVDKAEALIRWQHPQRGMVRPDLFIPLAEESGAIHEIGDWVFRQSAEVALQWQRQRANSGYCAKICQISVNMSPRQFVRGNPDAAWIEHLQAIGLNPEAMVVEITEGLLLDDQSDVTNKLRRFHEAGMQIALDDFGTGYSAMAYLKKFNIDYLKIDRSFVRDLETDPGDRAIAEAIVVMSHRLGLKVIAEGVETEGQREMLAAVGCEYVQGYLYAKPMPVEAFLEFVERDAPQL